MKDKWNYRLICVDDEEDIIKLYKEFLLPNEEIEATETELSDLFSRRGKRRYDIASEIFQIQRPSYELFLARSGEEAVEIFKQQSLKNEPIAVGFVDMKMPGGMDGMDTIKALKEIDPDLLCVIVTAYTDRSIEQLSTVFQRQDEWIYLNKPFTENELRQMALNLISAWNYRNEKRELDKKVTQKSEELLKAYNKLLDEQLKSKELIIDVAKKVRIDVSNVMSSIDEVLDGRFGALSDEQFNELMSVYKECKKVIDFLSKVPERVI